MHGPDALPLPLLITGITGVAGFNAFRAYQRQFPGRVIGIRPRRTWRLSGDGILPLDIEDRPGLINLFSRFRFGSVLNAIGNCALKSCELDPAMARQLNVESAETMAFLTRNHGGRLVHLSSDLVFSGVGTGNYIETDPVDPVTVYGRTMAEAEELLLTQNPAAAILRISLPMGPSCNRHAGAIDWIQSRFRAGRPATLYFDEIRSCTYTDDLNRVFLHFLSGQEAGLFHLGGPRPISLFQIAQVVNRVGGYEPDLLHGCPRQAAGPIPPRAGNVSLNSEKLYHLLGGVPFRTWPLGDEFWPTDRAWHRQRDGDWQGSVAMLKARLYTYPGAT